MHLDDIPDGEAALIDANILVYHRINTPGLTDVALRFLERVERKRLAGYTTTALAAEAVHKVMLVEAAQTHGLPASGIVARLKQRPHLVKSLSHKEIASEIARMGIAIEVVTPELLTRAEALFGQHGLLTNDSITLAAMEHLGLTHIATNDDDFDAVPGLMVWKPR